MANLIVKDGSGNNVELKATGTGTNADPFILERNVIISGNTAVIGTVAHDAVRSTTATGNPVLAGGVAQNSNAIAPVSDSDVSLLRTTLDGRLLVYPGAAPGLESASSLYLDTNSETVLIPAVAEVRHVIRMIVLTSDYGGEWFFRDTTGGPIRFSYKLDTNKSAIIDFGAEGWAAQSINANWTVTTDANTNTTFPTSIYTKFYRRFY